MVRDCKQIEEAAILYNDDASARTRGLLACEGGGQHSYRNGWVEFQFSSLSDRAGEALLREKRFKREAGTNESSGRDPGTRFWRRRLRYPLWPLIRGAVSGLPMRVIFSTAEKQMFSLVVQPEIKTVDNLKGKIVAISSFGGTQHLITAGTLRAVGINPERDVKMINVGNEAVRVEQLRSKQIHAAMINPPMSVMMKREGFGLLLHASDYVDLPLTGLGATTKKLKENPDQAKRVVRALNESLQFIRANQKETIDIFARWLRIDPSIAADTYDVALRVLSADGTASDKAIVASIEEAKDTGKIKGNFTPRDVSDFSLVRSVVAESKQKR